MSAPRIELASAGRSYGSRTALGMVSLVLQPGERVGIIGPSGGGKTTLLRVLAGAVELTSGDVTFDGVSLHALTGRQLTRHRRRCGIVEQGLDLVPQLRVHDNVLAGLLVSWPWYRTLASLLFTFERSRVARILDRVGLSDLQWQRTSSLSGGERQRVAVARAILGAPSLLIADEPTASLDPATAKTVVDELVDATSGADRTLVISTHWVSIVQDRVDRLIGIRSGEVAFDRPAADVTPTDLDALYAGSRERL